MSDPGFARGRQHAGALVEIAEHGVATGAAERNVATVVAVDEIIPTEIRSDRLDQIQCVGFSVGRALASLRTCEVEYKAAFVAEDDVVVAQSAGQRRRRFAGAHQDVAGHAAEDDVVAAVARDRIDSVVGIGEIGGLDLGHVAASIG